MPVTAPVLTYDLDVQDRLAFSEFAQRYLPAQRWATVFLKVITALVIGAAVARIVMVVASVARNPGGPAIAYWGWGGFVVGAVAGWFIGKPLTARYLRSTIKRRMRLQGVPEVQGVQLSLDDQGMRSATGTMTQTVAYASLPRIDETPDYVFIFLSKLMAVPIPKAKVAGGDLGQFLAELRARAPQAPYAMHDR